MNHLIGMGIFLFIYAVAYILFLKNHRQYNIIALPLVMALIVSLGFSGATFYAEPGFIYHVRTITGTEKVISDVGYNFHWFGRYNSWKRAMTVQSTDIGNNNDTDKLTAENTDSTVLSAMLRPQKIVFLDQVDALIQSSVRFKIPSEEEAFLRLVHEYRTPDNLLRATLIPAFRETLQATASLMTAEEYYSGGRTEFSNEFETQMNDGIYIVKRIEKIEKNVVTSTSSANASKGCNCFILI
jgi:regulator of protease activity HflC (stomatin/prohibitin superfamily)